MEISGRINEATPNPTPHTDARGRRRAEWKHRSRAPVGVNVGRLRIRGPASFPSLMEARMSAKISKVGGSHGKGVSRSAVRRGMR